MKRLSFFLLLFLVSTFTATTYAQVSRAPIVATDLLQIRQIDDVTVSPDSRNVVYTVRSIIEKEDEEGEYEYATQLWFAGGREAPRQLTTSREGASHPAWHPDGDRLAFVRPVDGTQQIFVMSMFGGEPVQVTRAEHGASKPAWAPDGTRLLFESTIPESAMRSLYGSHPWTSENRQAGPTALRRNDANPDGDVQQVRAWLEQNRDQHSPRVITRLDFQGERGLAQDASYQHYYLVEMDSIGTWSRPRSITPIWGSFTSADWHPDGARILLGGVEYGARHPDLIRSSDIFITYVDQPRPRRLFSLEGKRVSQPLVSPDGQTIAFIAQPVLDPGFAMNSAGVFPLEDPSSSTMLTSDFDRSVSRLRWSGDNWHLYFVAPSEGGFPLYRVRAFEDLADSAAADTVGTSDSLDVELEMDDPVPAGGAPVVERLTGADTGVRSFDATASTIYYALTRFDNPYELYSSTGSFEHAQRLTRHNEAWLADKQVAEPEHRSVQHDGFEIDYWVMRPPQGDAPSPMILQIHGGPSAMWGPGEASMWHEFQFLAAQGYVVVYSNPRGSGGYGSEFLRANFQDWGAGPAGDVLAVADAAAALPFVDESRQVVTGGSYAGYLTAWIIAHDHRFRAAVAQRGVYDLAAFLGEGNAWRLVPSHFGGYPWEDDPAVPPPAYDPWRPSPALSVDVNEVAPDTLEGLLPAPSEAISDTLSGVDGALDDASGAESDVVVPDEAADPTGDVLSFRDILSRESPLNYVSRIQTPLLIIHGDQDLRTGVSQSEMLYRSLKLLDRNVEYVRYPESDHSLSRSGDPRLRLDRILRIYEFMERWVQ